MFKISNNVDYYDFADVVYDFLQSSIVGLSISLFVFFIVSLSDVHSNTNDLSIKQSVVSNRIPLDEDVSSDSGFIFRVESDTGNQLSVVEKLNSIATEAEDNTKTYKIDGILLDQNKISDHLEQEALEVLSEIESEKAIEPILVERVKSRNGTHHTTDSF